LPEGAADYIVRGRGDTPVRSISDLMTCAWRSTGWILVRVRPASPPMGVRAAPLDQSGAQPDAADRTSTD